MHQFDNFLTLLNGAFSFPLPVAFLCPGSEMRADKGKGGIIKVEGDPYCSLVTKSVTNTSTYLHVVIGTH